MVHSRQRHPSTTVLRINVMVASWSACPTRHLPAAAAACRQLLLHGRWRDGYGFTYRYQPQVACPATCQLVFVCWRLLAGLSLQGLADAQGSAHAALSSAQPPDCCAACWRKHDVVPHQWSAPHCCVGEQDSVLVPAGMLTPEPRSWHMQLFTTDLLGVSPPHPQTLTRKW